MLDKRPLLLISWTIFLISACSLSSFLPADPSPTGSPEPFADLPVVTAIGFGTETQLAPAGPAGPAPRGPPTQSTHSG